MRDINYRITTYRSSMKSVTATCIIYFTGIVTALVELSLHPTRMCEDISPADPYTNTVTLNKSAWRHYSAHESREMSFTKKSAHSKS